MSGAGAEYTTGISRAELAVEIADISPEIDRVLAQPTARQDGNSAYGFGLSGQELVGVSRHNYGGDGVLYYLTVYGGDHYPRNPYRSHDRTVLTWWVSDDGTLLERSISSKRFSSTAEHPVEFPDPEEDGPRMIELIQDGGIEWFNPSTHRVGLSFGPCGSEAQVVPKRLLRNLFRRAGSAVLQAT